ncbi:FG-GAP repeat domain-containing protein [Microbacterium sp. NPDC057407]|uniref:FG-GAP repeat domain-containing protein n=1 Tax=Microbacterium sp. NPDC057407 TaxID=3346120 RepID=UPI003670AF11
MRRARFLAISALIAGLVLAGSPAVAADVERITVSGVVRLADGRTPAADEIRVAVMGDGTTTNPSAILGFASEGGAFEFSVRKQPVARGYTLAFSNASDLGSYLRQEVTVYETPSGTVPAFDVTLEVGGIIRGSVWQTNGEPAGDGYMTLDRYYTQDWATGWYRQDSSVDIGQDGSYEFRDIPAGPARVQYIDNRPTPFPGPQEATYPLKSKYWTELPSSPLFDPIEVAADVHEGKDIVAYAPSKLEVMYPCPECGADWVRRYSELQWLDPATDDWKRTEWYHHSSGSAGLAGVSTLGAIPGTYRLAVDGGYGLDPLWSAPFTFAENEDVDLEFARPKAALHVRTAAGDLIRYDNNGRGRLSAGVKVAAGLGAYAQIIDAGDLTSDGFRDLLARDGAGSLFRLDGTAGGSFSKPVRVRSDFANFTHLVPFSDVNRDGHMDILAKGRSGTMYWLAGDGHGGIGARTQIGKAGAFAAYRAFAFIGETDRNQPDVVALSDTGNVYRFDWDWVSGALRPLASRTKIATGWANVTQMVGVGPFNYDEYDDIVIRRSDGSITLQRFSDSGTIAGPIGLATKWSKKLLI